ncbi:M14 family metallocarboxypeptidase [Paenibacillus sp. NPDC056579]|uniref:M14 family metallopeptidase n=1 Tax=Paenibacillus sp. NPDC056579 TaxID=3345871 RepID=UPI00369500FC
MTIVRGNENYGYSELLAHIARLEEKYPFIRTDTIGTSVMGRRIPVVRLGTGEHHIHFNGAFHANEWITSLLLMKFVEDYADAYAAGTLLRGCDMNERFRQTSLWIVPMVNPDGVELALKGLEGIEPDHPQYSQLLEWNSGSHDFSGWKANLRGVDLNDQFPAHWETEKERRDVPGPGPRDYTGESPLCEPEAQAMAEFTRRHPFRLVMAFHTQGKEIYWNYRDMEPAEAETIANRFGAVSRYLPVKLTDSDAGYKDWFIQEFRKPGFTIEAGFGVNPLPIDQFPSIYEDVAGLMLEALVV